MSENLKVVDTLFLYLDSPFLNREAPYNVAGTYRRLLIRKEWGFDRLSSEVPFGVILA